MTETVDETSTADLVERARRGDPGGWDELIGRFQPLVTSATRRYRLSAADAADVSQTVWLRLFNHLDNLREPRALPGWIATTAANACLDVLAVARRTLALDPQASGEIEQLGVADAWGSGGERAEPDASLLRTESRRAVRRGLAELTPTQRELLLLVVADPPVPYKQISRRLGVPIGSIGPTRARCLKKLQRSHAVRELIGTATVPPSTLPAAA